MNKFVSSKCRLSFVFLLLASIFVGNTEAAASPKYQASYQTISADIQQDISQYSWRTGCPVPLNKLVLLTLRYWNYQGQIKEGELIVARSVADEVIQIFGDIFNARFPINQIKRIDSFQGNDEQSMAADNTSAFNCRSVTGKKGVFSKHSYGTAIDINPLINPYVKGSFVTPPAGIKFVNRKQQTQGLIKKGDPVYQAFKKRGWIWGGDWKSLKDYQHFEKSPHPER